MSKPHKHADLIKAWADGAEIELLNGEGRWQLSLDPTWSQWLTYRVKPEEPKPPTVKYKFACRSADSGLWQEGTSFFETIEDLKAQHPEARNLPFIRLDYTATLFPHDQETKEQGEEE